MTVAGRIDEMAEGNRKRMLALILAGVLAAGISGCSKSAGAGEVSAKSR